MDACQRAGVALLFTAAAVCAQDFSQRGFFETGAVLYPQTAPNDGSHAVGEAWLRYEAFYKVRGGLQFAGAFDARTDTHRQTSRSADFSWWDRDRLRAAFAVPRLSAVYARGRLTVEAGKQLIRWGRTDVLNPTDRFAPRDYLTVVENDFLGVTAARITYGGQSDTVDLVYAPRFTPSRVPLLNQRWAALPAGLPVHELEPVFPGGPQFGARWNHVGAAAEYSLSFYSGYDHLPLFRGSLGVAGLEARRYYPRMRMYGGDAAVPLAWLTLKAEAGYFTSSTPEADRYGLYVLQLERQTGEWFFTGGYAGQAIFKHGAAQGFSPLRGLTRAFVAHAGYTIDVNRSVAFEAVARQNGRGAWFKAEFSQAFGQHWRATVDASWIHGSAGDFLGQYRRNSYLHGKLRYSF